MSIYLTERESEITNHIYLNKMRRLYQSDKELFSTVMSYMPLPVTRSEVKTWNFTDLNFEAEEMTGRDKDFILKEGSKYTSSLVRKDNLPIIRNYLKARTYNQYYDRVIPYFQNAKYNGKDEFIWLYTYKIFLNAQEYFSLYQPLHQFRVITPVLIELLEEEPISIAQYSAYHTLTRREKEILKLVALGDSNNRISNKLFISPHTVRTHRNRIWKKLDIKHLRDAIRFAKLFDLV